MRNKLKNQSIAAAMHADDAGQERVANRTTDMAADEAMLDPLLLDQEDGSDLLVLHDALKIYKMETLQWAEKKSAAMPTPRAGWARSPRWALTSVALLACGLSAVLHVFPVADPPTVAVAAPTAQALADDEQLLQSVDAALSGVGAAPTEEELGLTQTRSGTNTHGRVAQWMN